MTDIVLTGEQTDLEHIDQVEQTLRNLEKCPALILNADYRPLSYFPLSLWSWQEAVKAIFRQSVTVVSEYDLVVRAPNFEMKLPSVLALKEFAPVGRKPAFTRFNVFLRGRWNCQYCADGFKTHELTFDHVVPRSKGGGRAGKILWRPAGHVTR
jgi:hypothetical protein